MDIYNTLVQIIVYLIIPWSVWVTKSVFDAKRDQAVSIQVYKDLKEDLQELKEKLDKLIEIQTRAHPTKLRRYSGSDTAD